jgi:glutamate N-acetyltransferase / amino-acid N-acetyltransferase
MTGWLEKPAGFSLLPDGTPASPSGFRASSASAGLKKKGLDVALLTSDLPACAAAAFTRNKVKAAPVLLSMKHIRNPVKGILINAKYANSFTGPEGMRDAVLLLKILALEMNYDYKSFLTASTGIIGQRIPVEKVKAVIPLLVKKLSANDKSAPRAIMTTDTVPKNCAVRFKIGEKTVTIGSMAKGSGMIAPNMATMLCFITTDAAISGALLRTALRNAVQGSFNRITVDGDTSTNDSVFLLSNRMAGNPVIRKKGPEYSLFEKALSWVCRNMALKIIMDGEGATKLVDITVSGARSAEDAEKGARTVACSPLVKTAFFGQDLNWGRIVNALGYSGMALDPSKISLAINHIPLLSKSRYLKENEKKCSVAIKGRTFGIQIDVHLGRHDARVLTTDLSYDYVKINGDYRS